MYVWYMKLLYMYVHISTPSLFCQKNRRDADKTPAAQVTSLADHRASILTTTWKVLLAHCTHWEHLPKIAKKIEIEILIAVWFTKLFKNIFSRKFHKIEGFLFSRNIIRSVRFWGHMIVGAVIWCKNMYQIIFL